MAERWYFFDSGANDGLTNMVIDEVLATQIVPHLQIPVLRFYQWQPYTISLGYHQREGEFHIDLCRKDGFDIVRRPTGGRAVFHAEELTYSVVLPRNSELYSEDILTTYNKISQGLLAGLKLYGVDAELVHRPEKEAKSGDYKQNVPCFSSSARYEIAYQARKLVGSAQRRYENAILQHGSILIGDFHLNLAKYVKLKNGISPEQFKQDLARKTATIAEILSEPVDWQDLSNAIKMGFQKAFNLDFIQFNSLDEHGDAIEKRKKTYPKIGGNHHER